MADAPDDQGQAPVPPPDSTLLSPDAALRHSPGRPAPAGLQQGTRLLDRYLVQDLLGRGAFGEVYAVADQMSDAEYALKRLPPDFMRGDQSSSIRANFQLVSTLTHPHIATTRFLETDPRTGELYVIMDLVRGPTLADWLAERLKKTPRAHMPHDLALGLCEQIADALDYAHSQPVRDRKGQVKSVGILHRDLKPGNIMLELDRPFRPGVPFVKVVDFGLAAEIQATVQGLSLNDPRSDVSGTPSYMAPEQWEGRTLTPAMDQWALAVILYELMAGTRPFRASSVHALAAQVREANPVKPPRVSDGQWVVLKRAFSPDRKDRYDSCKTMIRAFSLADIATSEMLRTKPFVRMVSMRQEAGAQPVASGPRPAAGPAQMAPRRVVPLLWVLGLVVGLGVVAGLSVWLLFLRPRRLHEPPTSNAPPSGAMEPGTKPVTKASPDEPAAIQDPTKKEGPAPVAELAPQPEEKVVPVAPREPADRPVASVPAPPAIRHGVHAIPWTTNQGVSLTLQVMDPDASEILYRPSGAGGFKSTGSQLTVNPRTGKPLPQMTIHLPHTAEKVELDVAYTDGQGQRQGPFKVVYDPQAAQIAEVKQILGMTRWVEFRVWDEQKDLLYFTHLVTYRRGIATIKFSIDSDALDQTFPLKPVDIKNPNAIPQDQPVYCDVAKTAKYVSVQVVYRDGSSSEVKKFER